MFLDLLQSPQYLLRFLGVDKFIKPITAVVNYELTIICKSI